jgi:hypothetical protein
MGDNKADLTSRTDFPGAIDDDHLIALLRDASTVLARAKLDGLARVVEFASVLIFGMPTTGESFVDDIASALDASDRLLVALSDIDDDKLVELGVDGHVAETGQALNYCATWGLNPGERLGNAIRALAGEVEAMRLMAHGAQAEPMMRADSRQVALNSIERKAEALLAALGVRKAVDETT